MMFDWDKLIRLLLPTFLRTAVLIELLKTLVAPLTTMHTAFLAWYENARYKANATASVKSLMHHINREFGTIATISEMDGKPLDFLVTTVDVVDEMRLRALINDYKLAGKSFTFSVGSVAFTSEFQDWACEDIIEIFTSEFTDWVCEADRTVFITSEFVFNEETEEWSAFLVADRAVESELKISGNIIRRDPIGNIYLYHSFEYYIARYGTRSINYVVISDQDRAWSISNFGIYDGYFTLRINETTVEIDPESDATYNYIYNG